MKADNLSRRSFLAALAAPAAGELHWKSIDEVAALLRARKLSPVELTKLCLGRIERLNPRLNAFITVAAEPALAQARAAEQEIGKGKWRGAMHGVPVALKDLFDTAGILTTAASQHYAGRVPAEDAEVVRRLKQAGAVILGKLNMDEFAYNFTSETSCYGPSRNPWDVRLTPGGSSGGSAIAVAAGLCLAALGSDTGGSIRLPASFCGITGLKPTYGRVPAGGVVPLAWSLDHVGPMCRTAPDAAIVLEAISGAAHGPEHPGGAKRLRLGVPKGNAWKAIEPDVNAAVESALKLLGKLSGGVEETELPPLPLSPQLPVLPRDYSTIIQAEAFAFHEEMFNAHPERYHAGTRQSIQNGARIAAGQYARALNEMRGQRVEVARVFERVDLIITPTAPGVAFELGTNADLVFLRNTAPWNFYGLPTISIPCGFSTSGLPIGLQITGAAGQDRSVLQLAGAFQQATDWHKRHPALS